MDPKNELSEKLRKYLIEFKFQNQTYYTVFGADLTTSNEDDKLSVDENTMLIFFKEVALVKQSIENKLFLFDPKRLTRWGAAMDPEMHSYTTLNLDVFMSDEIHQFNDSVLEEIYSVIEIVEDYGKQVGDDMLLGYLQSDLFRSFLDIASDCYLWGVRDSFDADFDYDTFTSKLHNCYNYLKHRIRIYG